MQPTPPIARHWLQEEFNRRRLKNRHYSLRAFAKALQMPSGRLSEILSSKRTITLKLGAQIAERLSLDASAREKFLACIERERLARKQRAGEKFDESNGQPIRYEQISVDSFHVISDWYHFAILNLLDTADFEPDPRWIAKRIGIAVTDVRAALERLERLKLIVKSGETWVKGFGNVETTQDVSSVALRRSHKQTLEQAIAALETVPLDERDVTSITMAIDPAKIAAAKAMIRGFRHRLCAFMEDGRRTEVYNLNVQLLPVTKKIPLERNHEKA